MQIHNDIKQFIKNNIDLLEVGDFQRFFGRALQEFSFPSIYMDMLIAVLSHSNIATVAQCNKFIKQLQLDTSIEDLSSNIPGLSSFKGDNSKFTLQIDDDQSRYNYALLGTLNSNMYYITVILDHVNWYGYVSVRTVYDIVITPKQLVTLINRIVKAYDDHRGTANELSMSFILKGFKYNKYTLFDDKAITDSIKQYGV